MSRCHMSMVPCEGAIWATTLLEGVVACEGAK